MNPNARTLAFIGFGMFIGRYLDNPIEKNQDIRDAGNELHTACHVATKNYPYWKWDKPSIRKIGRELERIQKQGWIENERTIESALAYVSMGIWEMVLNTKNERIKDHLRPVLLIIKEVQDAITPEISDSDFRLAEIKFEQFMIAA